MIWCRVAWHQNQSAQSMLSQSVHLGLIWSGGDTNLSRATVPKEVGPVRICLHESKLEQLLHAEFEDQFRNLEARQQSIRSTSNSAHLVTSALIQVLDFSTTDCDTAHHLHDQHVPRTAFPNPRYTVPLIRTQACWRCKEPCRVRFSLVVALVREFRFHHLVGMLFLSEHLGRAYEVVPQ
jgi:hypothetical protein